MADLKPSTAPSASALDGTEKIPCTQGGASRALTTAQIRTLVETLLSILTVDNIRVDGNTISAIDANGDITLSPAGTGVVGLKTLSASGQVARFGTTAADNNFPGFYLHKIGSQYHLDVNTAGDSAMSDMRFGWIDFISGHASNPGARIESNGNISLAAAGAVNLSSTADATATKDIGIKRAASGVLQVTDGSSGVGKIKMDGTTGAGTPLLGTNSPATTLAAPYTWLKFQAPDGTDVFVPAWK